MKYRNYTIEIAHAGRTDLDHKDDILCHVYNLQPDGMQSTDVQISFTITSGEVHDYGSAEAAVTAYMRRTYPDNEVQDIRDYRIVQEKQGMLRQEMKQLIERLLARHGGCVVAYPTPDEYGASDYPVTIPFYGRYGAQNINIVSLCLDADGRLKADGIDDRDGTIEKGLEVPSEHYAGALAFLAFALGIK